MLCARYLMFSATCCLQKQRGSPIPWMILFLFWHQSLAALYLQGADIVQRRWASGPSSTFFQSCSSHRKLWVIGPCFGGNQKSLRISVCMSVCLYVCMYCVYYLFNLLMGIHPIVWLSPVGSGNPLFHLIISLQLVIVLHRRIMCSQR